MEREVTIILTDETETGYGITISSSSFPGLLDGGQTINEALDRLDDIYATYDIVRDTRRERFLLEIPRESPAGDEFLFRIPLRNVNGRRVPDPQLTELLSRHAREVESGSYSDEWTSAPLVTGEHLEIVARPSTKLSRIRQQLSTGETAFVAFDAPRLHSPDHGIGASAGVILEKLNDEQLISGNVEFLPAAMDLSLGEVYLEFQQMELEGMTSTEHLVAH